MAGISSLESLQLLHSDLLALSESRLYNVNRLWSQLESKIAEFKKLLDKAPRKEQSRTALTSGRNKCLQLIAAPTELCQARSRSRMSNTRSMKNSNRTLYKSLATLT